MTEPNRPGKTAKTEPRLLAGPSVGVGNVAVYRMVGDVAQSQLSEGKKAVLSCGGVDSELTTLAAAGGIEAEGTFLNPADLDAFGGRSANPTLRLYSFTDTLRKAWSRKGAMLLFTSALGLLLAAAGFYFVEFSQSPTTTTSVAERSEVLLRWVAEPVSTKATDPGPVVARRETIARRCLTAMRDGESDLARAAGIECATTSPSFWRSKESAAIVAAIGGLITAALSLFSLGGKFKFGGNPG